MSALSEAVRETLANEYRTRAAELHTCVDPLSDDQFWRNPHGYGNFPGHLVLHLTGSLSYYIGSNNAESGYVRNRDLEFTDSVSHRRAKSSRNSIRPSRWSSPPSKSNPHPTGQHPFPATLSSKTA